MTSKYTLGASELTSKASNLWKAILAEFIGIFILNFFSCGACVQSNGDLVQISLAFGLSVFMAAMVSCDQLLIRMSRGFFVVYPAERRFDML
jgi:aquaporin rerated protein, invertebrate